MKKLCIKYYGRFFRSLVLVGSLTFFTIHDSPGEESKPKTDSSFVIESQQQNPRGNQDDASAMNAEQWNYHFQSTGVAQGDPPFPARYSGQGSLNNQGELEETVSSDFFTASRLWNGAELHIDCMAWQGFGLSHTQGIEAFPNGEAVKFGTVSPAFTLARVFIRQTFGLGGELEETADDQLTLAGLQEESRLTITLGRMSATDLFDQNSYANSARTRFLNWALITNATWDYPMNTAGFTTGLTVELNQPCWAVRYGIFQEPGTKNWWTIEDRILKLPYEDNSSDGEILHSWGMTTEVERRYEINSHKGTIRLLAYLNEANLGSYALALAEPDADISKTRAYRYKYGFGLNWEQEIAQEIGLFSRLGWNDGHNETWTWTDLNHSASLGVIIDGERWGRNGDIIGVAGVVSGMSKLNREFLEAGGTDILDGDGHLNYGLESVLETYYSFKVTTFLWLTLDNQVINNPACNKDRGPLVEVLAFRSHVEL